MSDTIGNRTDSDGGSSTEEDVHGEAAFPVEAILYICIGLVGVGGNGLVIVVMSANSAMRKSIFNLFIINQSVTDFLTSLFIVVNYPTVDYGTSLTGLLGELHCRLWLTNVWMWSLFAVSTWNLVVIAVERVLEVAYPIQHKVHFSRQHAHALIASCWCFGCLLNLLLVVPTSGVVDGVCRNSDLWPNAAVKKLAGISSFLLQFLLPVVVMVACYWRMYISLKSRVNAQVNATLSERTRCSNMARTRRSVLKILLLVSSCFFLCLVWTHALYLAYLCGYPVSPTSTLYYVTVYLAYLNTCCNPVIYALQYKQFQRAACQLLCRAQPAGVAPLQTRSTTTTSATM